MAPVVTIHGRCGSALMRSSHVASTSAPAPCRPSPRSRARSVFVQAADAFCRDKISEFRTVESKGKSFTITFVGAGGDTRDVTCRDNQYILDAAEANGLDLPATCRGGICGACVARVAKGSVDQSDVADLRFCMTEEEEAEGMTLLCMSRATSDLVVETQSDWGYSLGVCEWKGATGKFSSRPDPTMGQSWAEIKQ